MKIKTRRYHIYYYLRILLFMASLLPRTISLALAAFLGRIAFRVLPKYRDMAIDNLNRSLGDNPQKNNKIAKDVFINLAKNGADWVKVNSLSKKTIKSLVTREEGKEYLDNAMAKGNGLIFLASHFGNWEFLLTYLAITGYNGSVIARRLYFHKYDELINRMRARFNTGIIYRDESPKKILRVLRDGKPLGMLADQNVESVDGVFVDLFGRPAYTPTAPARLAITTGVDILPSFMIRNKDNTYKLVIEKPVTFDKTGNKEEDVKRCTQAWTDVFEKYVREYPEQWVWLHNRWKTQPGQK